MWVKENKADALTVLFRREESHITEISSLTMSHILHRDGILGCVKSGSCYSVNGAKNVLI